MPIHPANNHALVPGDAVFCILDPAQRLLWPEAAPVPGRVYRVECLSPGGTLKLEEPLTIDAQSLFSSPLPGSWFRKATVEEIAAERRHQRWETDQLMLTAMKQAL